MRVWGAFAALLTLSAAVLAPSIAGAQSETSWSPTGLTAPTMRLITPSSGALLAVTDNGLARSDDAGASWRTLELPGGPLKEGGRLQVDPTNHDTLYLGADEGVYKSEDGAAGWRQIVPADPDVPLFLALAVSSADPNVLYLARSKFKSGIFRFLRSTDGGATWETIERQENNPHVICYWVVSLLQPHPTDPQRVFRAAACGDRAQHAELQESRDRGLTWTTIYTPQLARPHRLVGATPDRPQRLIVAMNKDLRGGGSSVVRSDDDGATWTKVLDYAGGGGMTGGGPNVGITGLSVDPTNGDRLLVGLSANPGTWAMPPLLRLSLDGGTTWTDATSPGVTKVNDVAFGIDGRLMFAATDTGVWRSEGIGIRD